MKVYFRTDIQNVYINGVLKENVQVVSGIQSTTNDDGIPTMVELPQEYWNADIIGCAYFPNEETIFVKVDEEVKPIERSINDVYSLLESKANSEQVEQVELNVMSALVDMFETMVE